MSLPSSAKAALQQAEAEGLTLLKADSASGYKVVYVDKRNLTKPYKVQVQRGGKSVFLGTFATAEEAALCFARTPEGRVAASAAAAAQPPMTAEEAVRQAEAEGLMLLKADNISGYQGVRTLTAARRPSPTRRTCAAAACKQVHLLVAAAHLRLVGLGFAAVVPVYTPV